MSTFLYELGRWCYRHRGRVLAAWLAALVLVGGVALTIRQATTDSFRIPGTQSQEALDQLRMTFPQSSDAGATMIITLPEGRSALDPSIRTRVTAELDRLGKLPIVSRVNDPYSEYVTGLISDDERSLLVGLQVSVSPTEFGDENRQLLRDEAAALEAALPAGSKVFMGGAVFAINIPKISLVEATGVLVALVVLIVALGSFLAAFVPIVTALVGVALAMAITFGATRFTDISSTTPMLALMLGLAVGIDYALFILARHRGQLRHGMDAEESAARSVATAGSAVIFAGTTVIIALIGLAAANIPFLTVMGQFAAVAVAIGVLIALTLLPAFMGFLGERMRPRRAARTSSATTRVRAEDRGPAAAWIRLVTKVPILTVVVVVAALGALTYPAKDLQMALPNAGHSPVGQSDRDTFDLISTTFGPGYNGPLIVTATLLSSTDPLGVMSGLKSDIEALPGVALVPVATPNQNADTGIVQVFPTTGPDDPATERLVDLLRAQAPRWQEKYGVETAVTGITAVQIDISRQLANALLPFGIFVVGLSLILLTVVFRSIAVPIKAALGYLLSVGAAFGATTLVFNKGYLASVVNLHEPQPIISFLPIILMGILFGLAMDYEVFLVSRMREEHVHGLPARSAVKDGFVHTATVVTAAALIMFSVFAFFVPTGDGAIKPIAFGLAIGVAIDAFVVRMTLVPAVMALLGEKAWWLPRWLDARMPELDIEGERLVHQLELAAWPAPGDPHIVYAEGLTVRAGGYPVIRRQDVVLAPGGALVLAGHPVPRALLGLTLAGRVRPDEGRVKVLGYVLPDQARHVRRRTACFDARSHRLAERLRSTGAPLVFVDDADLLTGDDRAALGELLAGRGTRAVVLGATNPDLLADLLPPSAGLLSLTTAVPASARTEGSLR